MRNRGRGRKGGRLIAAVGSAFTPASFNNLTLWLDPYYGTFQERTGASATTPAAANNDPVGTWRSRTGEYYTAPADAARPLLSVVGSVKRVVFDPTDDALTGSVTATGGYSLFAAGTPGTQMGGSRRLFAQSVPNALLSLTGRTDVGRWFLASAFGPTNPAVPAGRATVAVVNGPTAPVAYLNAADVTNATIALADWNGIAFGGGEPADATVDALVVYSRVLSAAEMLILHNWAMALSI